MTKIIIPLGDNIKFYGVDLSDDIRSSIEKTSIALVNSTYSVSEDGREIPLVASFMNHLANKESNFNGKVNDIGMSGPLYTNNYVTCTIPDSSPLRRNIIKSGGYESEHGFIELNDLLGQVYQMKGISSETSNREKFTIELGLSPQEAWMSIDEINSLRDGVVFEERDEKSNKVEVMMLMNFFLDTDLYIALPYGTYKNSIICTEKGLLEYINEGKIDASLVYKRSDVIQDKSAIVIDEKMKDFVSSVRKKLSQATIIG